MTTENIDLVLFTDGSGYTDGFGGWCYLVADKTMSQIIDFGYGCSTGTTVDIMEMTGAIEGVKAVTRVWEEKAFDITKRLDAKDRLPTVVWYGDRESMIKSAKWEYERSNSPELWDLFEKYESQVELRPTHLKFDITSEEQPHLFFRFVDLHASTMRVVAKDYHQQF